MIRNKEIFILTILFLLVFPLQGQTLNKAAVDITKMDINALSEALTLKIITSEELVNLYLDRINEYDSNYHTIINLNPKALTQAKTLDEERTAGKVRSLLHGIPILVKDNIDVLGMPTTGGAKALKDNYPKANAFVIQKLIDAGAIILGKTNMSEFAFYASASYSSYGRVKNAYNLDYSAYGSSGGSAVALAASFSAAALGTDTNSSARLPAAANNVIGLRPTLGLLSRSGVLPYDVNRDTIGPITNTVFDAIILMNIMNGYDAIDQKSINQSAKTYQSNLKTLEGIIIGVPTDLIKGSNQNNLDINKETYPEITALMEVALAKMQISGAQIVYIDDYYVSKADHWYHHSVSGYTFCDGFNNYIKGTVGNIRSFSALASANNKVTSISNYLSDCNSSSYSPVKEGMKEEYQHYIKEIMTKNHLDVIVYPATKNKLLKNQNPNDIINVSAHASSTINYPTITLPLGFDSDNLPYGIEFMVPTHQEQLLFDIALIYEKINGNNKNPAIAPSLYIIPKEVENLVANYQKAYPKKHAKWLKDVENYFRTYSKNENIIEEARILNKSYKTSNIKTTIISGCLALVIGFVSLIITFIIVLLIRKHIRRIIRKMKRKNHIYRKK